MKDSYSSSSRGKRIRGAYRIDSKRHSMKPRQRILERWTNHSKASVLH